MKRASIVLLSVSILMCLLTSACFAGSYQAITGIPFSGATDDRGIGVNTNPTSPYYGYFYGATNSNGCVRIWKPVANGTGAISYEDTGRKLSYATSPPSSRIHSAFVGPDDVVWVADHAARQICTGTPDGHPTADPGGELVAQFQPSNNPRSIYVTGRLGQAGTRVYVAMNDPVKKCEVWKYDGTAWALEKDLGDLGLGSVWFVTVDKSGNSYWAANAGGSAVVVKKVDASFNTVTSFGITKPSWLPSWTVGGISYVNDPTDAAHPEYLYVCSYATTCVLRYDLDGNYIDGYGNLAATTPPAGTWTTIALSGPGGQNCLWVVGDDQHNTYIMTKYPGVTTQAYKVHLQTGPQPAAGLAASNDVYGQIRLSWTPPAPSANNPTGFKIYRGTAPGAETLYATTDGYPKWKDAIQGVTAGTFYYYVTAFNGAGESARSNEVGPISVGANTAPAPNSLGIAMTYSELNKADTTGNGNYDASWALADKFLTDRGIAYTKIYDADSTQANLENDSIAGYKLLILADNRDMSSYSAQCVKDYVKYSNGRVLANYNDSIADYRGIRLSDYQLADVFRAHASTAGDGGSPWVHDVKYQFLRKLPTAPEAAQIFAGIGGAPDTFDGAQAWSFNHYLMNAYTDGTASEVGKWYDAAGAQSIADPNDAGIVVGYRDSSKTAVQSVVLGSYVWVQASGTLSSEIMLENIFRFLGVTVGPHASASISDLKQKSDGSGVILENMVATKGMIQPTYIDAQKVTIPARLVFYVEEPNRSSGIKVVLPMSCGGSITNGQIVNIGGTIETQNGERDIAVNDIVLGSTADSAAPVHINVKDIGGSGITAGAGLGNIGLFVNIAGIQKTVTTAGANGAYFFMLDDGSGVTFGSQPDTGIKVYGFSTPDTVGGVVHLQGVIGAELDTDGTTVIPVIRIGDSDMADAY